MFPTYPCPLLRPPRKGLRRAPPRPGPQHNRITNTGQASAQCRQRDSDGGHSHTWREFNGIPTRGQTIASASSHGFVGHCGCPVPARWHGVAILVQLRVAVPVELDGVPSTQRGRPRQRPPIPGREAVVVVLDGAPVVAHAFLDRAGSRSPPSSPPRSWGTAPSGSRRGRPGTAPGGSSRRCRGTAASGRCRCGRGTAPSGSRIRRSRGSR